MATKKTTKTQVPADAANKAPRAKAAKAAKVSPEARPKKPGCPDVAAKLLGETGQAMTYQEMIDAMAAIGYWTSPGGETPSATLYAAILRDVPKKGEQVRFTKTERGKFAAKA